MCNLEEKILRLRARIALAEMLNDEISSIKSRLDNDKLYYEKEIKDEEREPLSYEEEFLKTYPFKNEFIEEIEEVILKLVTK